MVRPVSHSSGECWLQAVQPEVFHLGLNILELVNSVWVCIWPLLRWLLSPEESCISVKHIFARSTFSYLWNRSRSMQRSWSHWQSSHWWPVTNLLSMIQYQVLKMNANWRSSEDFHVSCQQTRKKQTRFFFPLPKCKWRVMPLSSMKPVWVSRKSDSGALLKPAPHHVGGYISTSFSQGLFVCIFPLCVSLFSFLLKS